MAANNNPNFNVEKGNITTGDIDGTGIAIGHGAIANVTINQIVQGLGDLPTHYDGPVRNFLDYYLGTTDNPAPFGGRQDDIVKLNTWLDNPNSPHYALLVAPAGRGKSALLCRWVAQLQQRPDVATIFFPISIRYGTNRENIVFSSLYARFASLYGDKALQSSDAQLYRGAVADYLRRPTPDGRHVVVILDALDEAAGWDMTADLFPIDPPSNLHILVSARIRAGDTSGRGWLSQLGWDSHGRALIFPLDELNRAGVADTLKQMGNPLDKLAVKFDVVDRLFNLSEGDPLLIRLYVESLLPYGAHAALFGPEDLLTLKPGLHTYLQRWLDEQRRLWGQENPLKEKALRAFINLCALAFGPLMKADLLAMAPGEIDDSWVLIDSTWAINRLVIGDGETIGFVFSHPRLRDYFAERLTREERKRWTKRFLSYGQNTLDGLNAQLVKPSEISSYPVRYYGAHLASSTASPEEYYHLMSEGWLRAWEWVDGAPDGFLVDAQRVARQAQKAGPTALGHYIAASSCFASIISLSNNIPDRLLIECAKSGVVSSSFAKTLARLKPNHLDRIRSLVALSSYLNNKEGQSIIVECLTSIYEIDAKDRMVALEMLVEHMPTPNLGILVDIFGLIESVQAHRNRAVFFTLFTRHFHTEEDDLWLRLIDSTQALKDQTTLYENTLSSVVAWIGPLIVDKQGRLATRIRRVASTLDDKYRRQVLKSLNSTIPPTTPLTHPKELLDEAKAPQFFRDTLETARQLRDNHYRAQVLTDAAMSMPLSTRDSILSEALLAARAIDDNVHRVRMLGASSDYMPPNDRRNTLLVALQFCRQIRRDSEQATAIACVAPHIQKGEQELLDQAIKIARSINQGDDRAAALSSLGQLLPPQACRSVFSEALTAAKSVASDEYMADAYAQIASALPQNEVELQHQLVAAIYEIDDEIDRARAISSITPYFYHASDELLSHCLDAVRSVAKKSYRLQAFQATVQCFREGYSNLHDKAIYIAREMDSGYSYSLALIAVCHKLNPNEREALVNECFQSLSTDHYSLFGRTRVMVELCSFVSISKRNQMLRDALNVFWKARDTGDRLHLIHLLMNHFAYADIRDAVSSCIDGCGAIQKDDDILAYCSVVEKLPGSATKQLTQVIQESQATTNIRKRSKVLCAASRSLPKTPSRLHIQVLELLPSISKEPESAEIIKSFVGYWPLLCKQMGRSELEVISDVVNAFVSSTRPHLVSVVEYLLPVIHRLGGEKAVRETAQAIIDTAKWWP